MSNSVKHDPEYEFVPAWKDALQQPQAPKGRQCGECGMKFEYGVSYGYYCGSSRCPMGFGR